MTTQNTPARFARIMVLVIIGVALLAAVVSSVVVTFWVLLMAVPLLATLWLVRNLLDGAGQNIPARIARIMALVVIGVALLAAGVSSVMTLWTSSFARFMLLENLGLDGRTAAAITRVQPSTAVSSFSAASWPSSARPPSSRPW
jgi:predicted PurR-regulated permease PerM